MVLKKIALITGINGQDGSYLSEFLIEKGYEVHGILKRNSVAENQTYRLENVYNKIKLHYGDLTDLSSLISVIQKVMPDEIYNLFKDATVKYDKVKDVKVFENPARPRPAGARLQAAKTGAAADVIKVTWALTTTSGLVFSVWNEDSICLDPTPPSEANANCRLTLDVR
jgi:NAD(P)-dependent dehydrogenase (short-subunit alcohol dehydrogenase family)